MPNYKKNFLTDVIFRIDYPLNLELIEKPPENFQKAITDKFPILEPVEQFGVEIKGTEGALTTKKLKKITWRFSNRDKVKYIELDSEYLAIIFKKYKDYDDLKKCVREIVGIFYDNYATTEVNRLGLRYINKVNIDEDDFFNWEEYIDANLIQNLKFISDQKQIRRSMSSFIVYLNEDDVLSFKYGIFNSSFPNEIVKKEFVLDYDCYAQTQLGKEDVLTKVDQFNEAVSDFFEKSVGDKLREKLNE